MFNGHELPKRATAYTARQFFCYKSKIIGYFQRKYMKI